MVSREQAAQIRAQEQRIHALEIDDSARHLVLAHLYASHDLYAEAIEELTAHSSAEQTPAVSLMLGKLYLETELTSLAAEHYRQALTLAEQAGSLEGQAQAHEYLGRIEQAAKHFDTARAHLEQALEQYEQLGDTDRAEEIRTQMETL
jgi:tetratricopeptide (TPR) repeat protein